MKLNSRKVGEKLELIVSNLLGVKQTRNSGALADDADLKDSKFLIECKVTQRVAPSLPSSHLKKLSKQALKWNKDWIYIIQTEDGKQYAITELNMFAELYQTARKVWEEKKQ